MVTAPRGFELRRVGLAAIAALVCASSAAHAAEDAAAHWTSRAIGLLRADRAADPVVEARGLALLDIAEVKAMISRREGSAADQELAADTAAERILAALYPAEATALNKDLAAAISSLEGVTTRADDIAAGEAAGAAVLAARRADAVATPDAGTYRPVTSPGVYVGTSLPAWTNYPTAKPFALTSPAQFRPGPPPSLNSELWARDYNETRELGGARSVRRTAWQTETAKLWRALSGPEAWNHVALTLLASRPHTALEAAVTLRDLNVALYDSYLAVSDAKFHYNFWRPITAIRNGDITGNPATPRDASWTPAIPTPPFPEYPCAHCIIDTAASTVLEARIGPGPFPDVTLSTPELPGVVHHYTSMRQLVEEVDNARIWGGVHFRNSAEVADDMGRKVGVFVLAHEDRLN